MIEGIIYNPDYPLNEEDCFRILEIECKLRKEPEYIAQAKEYLDNNRVPPESLHAERQSKAVELAGFILDKHSEYNYMFIVSRMNRQKRKPYFFLVANDMLFKPKASIVNKSIVTQLHDQAGEEAQFT